MRTRVWGGWAAAATTALALAACDGGAEELPAGDPGGPGLGGSARADADVDRSDAGVLAITGEVCVVADVRLPGNCAVEKREGLVVKVEASESSVIATVMTDAQGRFTTPALPALDRVILVVEDPTPTLHRSGEVVELAANGTADVQIHAITEVLYGDILTSSLVTVTSPNGVVAAHVLQNDVSLAGASVSNLQGAPAYYDATNDPLVFSPDELTSGLGFAIWFDVLPATSAGYQVSVGNGTPKDHTTTVLKDGFVFTTAIQ
jgi:hypothetical protein